MQINRQVEHAETKLRKLKLMSFPVERVKNIYLRNSI